MRVRVNPVYRKLLDIALEAEPFNKFYLSLLRWFELRGHLSDKQQVALIESLQRRNLLTPNIGKVDYES